MSGPDDAVSTGSRSTGTGDRPSTSRTTAACPGDASWDQLSTTRSASCLGALPRRRGRRRARSAARCGWPSGRSGRGTRRPTATGPVRGGRAYGARSSGVNTCSTMSSTVARGAGDSESATGREDCSLPSSGSSRRRRGRRGALGASGGTTTIGLLARSSTCSAVWPTGRRPTGVARAPNTAAMTSALATASSSDDSTGPSRIRSGTSLAARQAHSGASIGTVRTWTASTEAPSELADAEGGLPATGGAAALASRRRARFSSVDSLQEESCCAGQAATGLGGRPAMRTRSGWVQLTVTVSCSARTPMRLTSEPEPERERLPGAGQARIDVEELAPGAQTEEAVGEGLPHATHRGQVEAAGGGAGEVVEVEPGGEPEQLQRPFRPAGTGEERGVDRRRERAAVGGARFVERRGWPPASPARPRRARGGAA